MKLKKIYIVLAVAGTFALSSCKDYLNVDSPSQFDANFVFSNSEDAAKVLNGVYEEFAQDGSTSRQSNAWMQNTDVECINNPTPGIPTGASRSDIWSLQGSADASFGDIYKAWNSDLLAIERANQVIKGVNASAIKNDAEMQQILGEAYCLKAYRYWMMCNFWGDVPYYDTPASYGDDLDKPKTDKNIIYSKCLQDLVNIEGKMKFSDVNTGGIERMNRDFALGLIARIALFRAGYGMTADGSMKRADDYLDVANNSDLAVTYTDNNGVSQTAKTYTDYYQMAKNYAQKLISLKPRSLRSDYAQIFKDECQYKVNNNDEVLYEVAFTQSYGGDVGWCIGVANTGNCAQGTTTDQVALNPVYYMSFADHDIRRDATCARYQNMNDTIATCGNPISMYVAKWNRAWVTASLGSGSSKGTGINWPLMRYSDVLLMLAEAENQLNGPTSVAKDALEKVRARAFASSSTYDKDVTQYIDSVSGSKEMFFNAIVNERAWEFGGECLRKFDLIRWNNYGNVINNVVATINNWAISTNPDLLTAVQSQYPNAVNYGNWADSLYFSKTKSAITWKNDKYKITDPTIRTGSQGISWGKYLLKTVTTYNYNGTSYTSIVKSTNTTANTVTYVLGGTTTFTVPIGTPSGITKSVSYQAGDYVTRLYRGYTGTTGVGTGVVPYLLPISTTTLSSSSVLNNNGYGFSSTYTGNDVNVVFGVITSNYN